MKIGVIHANTAAVAPLREAFNAIDPLVTVVNFCNEEMLLQVGKDGGVTDQTLRMFARMVFDAADAGVDGIMIACSVFCSYADIMKPFLKVPILAVDEPALREAVKRGGKIGILATTPASAPACEKKLVALRKTVGAGSEELTFAYGIVPEALEALKNGEPALHDALIANRAQELVKEGCSTLFLSQITMARAKQAMGSAVDITLTTPEEGVRTLLALCQKRVT